MRRVVLLGMWLTACAFGTPHAQALVPDSSSHSAQMANDESATLDFQDPKTFVRVIEQSNHRSIYTLFAPRKSSYGPDAMADEVDRASAIRIQFERPEILADTSVQSLDGDITITASLTKADGSKPPIEVLGYSTIGEKAKVAAVRVRSGDQLISSLKEISDRFSTIQVQIDNGGHSATHVLSTKEASQKDLTRDSAITRLQATLDSVRRTPTNTSDTAAVRDSADALRALVLDRQRADDELLSKNDNALIESIASQQAIVLDSRDILQILLGRLAHPADTATFNAVVAAIGRDPDAVSARATLLVDSALPAVARLSAENAAQRDTLTRAISKILGTLRDFSDAGLEIKLHEGVLRNRLVHTFLGRLSEGDIVVAETGAQPGDVITIDIMNQPVDPDQPPHELRLRLTVQEFGFVQHTTDSFLFIKRLDVHTQTASAAGGGSAMDTTAAAYNYLPTAGVTYGWVLNWRRQWARGWVPDMIRFLQPGLGVNVSFPHFGNKVTEVTPSSGDTPATIKVSDSSTGDGFDLALGGVVTLFNGAVQVAYGADLTSGHPRTYWGIGFSFIRTISAATQLTSGSK